MVLLSGPTWSIDDGEDTDEVIDVGLHGQERKRRRNDLDLLLRFAFVLPALFDVREAASQSATAIVALEGMQSGR